MNPTEAINYLDELTRLSDVQHHNRNRRRYSRAIVALRDHLAQVEDLVKQLAECHARLAKMEPQPDEEANVK